MDDSRDDDLASLDEVHDAIDNLTDGDNLRPRSAAQALLGGGVQGWRPEDLVAEAMERIVAMSRHWPKDTPFPTFVKNVMRSLVCEARKGVKRRREDLVPMSADEEEERPRVRPLDEIPSGAASVLDDLIDRERAGVIEKRLLETFKDDEVVLTVIMGLMDEMAKSEIQTTFNITHTQYNTARTAIRRAAKHILRNRG